MYCFSNGSMPGILKVGMTKSEERTPDKRLREANSSDTWRPPAPYVIEFAKKISDPEQKEIILHRLLTQYTERPNPRREFFKVTTEEVKSFFELMDGEWWNTNNNSQENEVVDESDEQDEFVSNTYDEQPKCRDMRKCFANGQQIRHRIGITEIIIGIYNQENNTIMYEGQLITLNKFTENHYKKIRPDRTYKNNAWKECECEINGEWVSTYNLSEL